MGDERAVLSSLFAELAELTVLDELDPQSFRVRAYENASHAVRTVSGDLAALTVSQLSKTPGIGKSSAQKIREFLDTGRIGKLEQLRAKFPAEVLRLARLPGLGPKKLQKLRAELGVESLDDLRRAIEAGAVQELPGFGEKTAQNLREALERAGPDKKREQRTPLAEALPVAEKLVSAVAALPWASGVQFCGSLRRYRETIGDIDIVVASTEPAKIMEGFTALPWVRDVIARGDTKTSIHTAEGLQVDLRVVPPEAHGAAVLYFTGSKAHNIELRQRALTRGWTLNEYALAREDDGAVVASATEEEIYAALGLPFIPPPMREATGEVERAETEPLPYLTASALRGDLHVPAPVDADADALGALVAGALDRGYAYLGLVAPRDAHPDALRGFVNAVREVAAAHPAIAVLAGAERAVALDGAVGDVPAEVDYVVATVADPGGLDEATQTARLVAAVRAPRVRVLSHPTARRLPETPSIDLDLDALVAACRDADVALEIAGDLGRLDLPADMARRASTAGARFSVCAGSARLDEVRHAVALAQRGWVPAARVIETLGLEDLRRFLCGEPNR